MLRPLRGERDTSWGHGCSWAIKIETDACLRGGRMWGFFESWVWASPDTSRLFTSLEKVLLLLACTCVGTQSWHGKQKLPGELQRDASSRAQRAGRGESLQSALFAFSSAWLKIPKSTIQNKPHPQFLSGINREQEEKPRSALVVSLPLAPAGWKSVGLPAFHPGGKTHRQGGECNLLFQRKARSRSGVKVLIPGQREPSLPLRQTHARQAVPTSTPLPSPPSFNEEMKENTVFLYCPFKEISVCIVGSPFLHKALTLVWPFPANWKILRK